MNKQYVINFIVIVLSWTFISCQQTTGNEDNKTNYVFEVDSTHINNELVTFKKESIIKAYNQLDKWYDEVNNGIEYYMYWRINGIRKPDSSKIINYVKTEILEDIKNAELFNNLLKKRILNKIETLKSATNLAALMTNDTIGYMITNIKPRSRTSYQQYLQNEHGIINTPAEAEFISDLSADSVKTCLMEMIKIKDNDQARLSMPFYLIVENRKLYSKVLVFDFIKKEKNWLLANCQILDDQRYIN